MAIPQAAKAKIKQKGGRTPIAQPIAQSVRTTGIRARAVPTDREVHPAPDPTTRLKPRRGSPSLATQTHAQAQVDAPSGRADAKQLAFALAVGAAIRCGRKARKWTQAMLAEQASLSANYIARLERGETGPSLFVAYRIASALGIGLEGLLSIQQRQVPPPLSGRSARGRC
ncbi:MAG: hypothetical protein NVS3B20_26930 [Polyangiales bacterium]